MADMLHEEIYPRTQNVAYARDEAVPLSRAWYVTTSQSLIEATSTVARAVLKNFGNFNHVHSSKKFYDDFEGYFNSIINHRKSPTCLREARSSAFRSSTFNPEMAEMLT